jgi:exopolysaccharide production protein ExoZ
LAATAVVLCHAYGFVPGLAGVDFFFIISGFVIFHSAKGKSAPEFLKARFWRIFPIYWIAVAPWIISAHAKGKLGVEGLIQNSLLFPFWWSSSVPVFYLAWTLIFECLFYAAAAVTIWMRSPWITLAIFISAMAGWAFGGWQQLMWLGNPIILEFFMGMAIAVAPKDQRVGKLALIVGVPWFLLAPATPLSIDFRDIATAWVRIATWGIPAALITYGAMTFEEKFKGRVVALLCIVGAASYSIYLFHPVITYNFDWAWRPGEFIAAFVLGITAWLCFERPIMRILASTTSANVKFNGDAGTPAGIGTLNPIASDQLA